MVTLMTKPSAAVPANSGENRSGALRRIAAAQFARREVAESRARGGAFALADEFT
jgi:hypothetical protein